jgi:hypothetical protein
MLISLSRLESTHALALSEFSALVDYLHMQHADSWLKLRMGGNADGGSEFPH